MKNPPKARVEYIQKKKQPHQRGIAVEEREMKHPTEITSSVDEQIPQHLQTEKDEIEEKRKGYHIIDIEESINEMLKDLDDSSIKSRTIFKVNVSLRKSNSSAYTPKMISIGPYHRKNSQLGPMEKYKLLYLQRFFQRKKEGFDMKSCINELEKLKEEALKCYEDIEELRNNGQFCQMLLLDGCFVVEFIRECCDICIEGKEDIISFGGYICHQVFRDLMLLENQLPFFVLNKLHDMTKQADELPLLILVNASIVFFVDLPNMISESFKNTENSNIKHLLHAVHIASCHGKDSKKDLNNDITRNKVMPNATELSQAGVSFVKAGFPDKLGDKTSLFDSIKFENGLMTIPCFRVYDGTETILRNLIAYEQQSSDVQCKYFTDFAAFMDHLIDSEKDVSLLRQKGIIENWMGEDKEVASLFNKNGNGVSTYSDFYYKEECSKASEHCEKRWNKTKASLRHNYFNSPWKGASTVAAITLLILTTIQTILAFTGSVK